MPCRAIHGDTLGDRVPADTVGRRGLFLKRRLLSHSDKMLPLEEMHRAGVRSRAPEGRGCTTGARTGGREERVGYQEINTVPY